MNSQYRVEPESHRASQWAALIARALATSVEVFLHDTRTFGERYLGAQAAIAAGILLAFPVLFPDEDPAPLFVYFVLYLVMCGAVRASAVARRRRGEPLEHSYYSGRPRFGRLTDRIGETRVKGVLEPMLVVIAGALLIELAPSLGTYMMVAGGALLFTVQSTLATERHRVMDLNDAQLAQRHLAEQWRRLRND